MNVIRQMLTNPNAQSQASAGGGFRGGGLAGVASKAQGHTIKVVDDQVDYSLWEFYYDPSKDVKQVLPGGAGMGAVPGAGANTFNRAPTTTNRPTPNNPPAATSAPAQPPPDVIENPNAADTPPPEEEPSNPEDSNPTDAPSEPPQ
jgi:hypothetical protein